MEFSKIKIFLFVLFFALIDFITKFFVSKYNIHYSIINYTLNSGVAFGMFKGFNLLFIIIDLFAVLFLGYYLFSQKIDSFLFKFGFILILAGAIGNLTDRILYSGVIDFIDLKYWYVFNFADVFIVIGVGLILLNYFIKNK